MTSSREIRPFPFASLDALSRGEVTAAAALRRAARAHVRLEALAHELGEITRERVVVLVRRYKRADATRSSAGDVGVVLEAGGGERSALIEVEAALATALTARALQRPPPRIVDSSRPPAPALCGALAAIALACLRRAHAGAALRVLATGPAAPLARELSHRHPLATTAWLTVLVGPDAFEARVTIPDEASASHADSPFDAGSLERLGDAPIALPLVAATCLASRIEIATLSPGDAFVVPSLSLRTMALVPARGERGLRVEVAEDGRLVVRGLCDSHPWEVPVTSADASSMTTPEVLEDAPLIVRVELGAVEMKAREWASLAPGDVVGLGRKIGEPAVLRVGGVEVARGELVQVDGEYGVRILGRADGP